MRPYLAALASAHAILQPRLYAEIGSQFGNSLAVAKCPAVGIDPAFKIQAEVTAPTRLFKRTSDAFFALPNAAELLGGRPDLAFVDGLHLSEFALRDFIYFRRHMSERGVVVFDDILPKDIAWTSRTQPPGAWTGDVYRVIAILREYCPDLAVDVFDIDVEGLAFISNLDAAENLEAAYPEIEKRLAAGDWLQPDIDSIRRTSQPRPAKDLPDHLVNLARAWNPSATARPSFSISPASPASAPVAPAPPPVTLEGRPVGSSIRGDFLAAYQKGVLGYTYRGVIAQRSPIDTAILLRLMWELKPRTIIEIGTAHGGGALHLADIASTYNLGARVYTIDLHTKPGLDDRRISLLRGDVHNLGKVFNAHSLRFAPRPWLVIEDSAHTYEACRDALAYLADAMTAGDMLVMEDGNVAELGLADQLNGGPARAIAEFLATRPGIFGIRADLCDMFGPNATAHPNGYLARL